MRTAIIETPELTIWANGKHQKNRINRTQFHLTGDFLVVHKGMAQEVCEIIAERKDRLDGYPCKPYWEYQV